MGNGQLWSLWETEQSAATAAAEESRVSDTHFERGASSINSPIHPA